METAGLALQALIDARQALDAIEYGIRSLELSRPRAWRSYAYGCSPAHEAQIAAACDAGAAVLERDAIGRDAGTLFLLKRARKDAREQAKAAQAAVKAIGGRRQLRLALAA